MKDLDEAALRQVGGVQPRLLTASIAVLGSIVASFQPAKAQTAFTLPAPPFEVPGLPSASGNWTATIGIGGDYRPDYPGSKNWMLSPVPIFSIRRAGMVKEFRGPRDSPSIALIDFGDLRAGPAVKYVKERKSSDHSELNGLADVKAAFEFGGFVEYYAVDWLRLRSELRQGVGGHKGTVADFSSDFIVPLIDRLTISAGPRFTWKSAKAIAPYFDVDAAQSLASGLPAFDAKGGAYSVGFGAQVSYRINPQWEVHAYVEYEKLLGDAANSPIVKLRGTPNQTTIGLGASYSFDFKIR
ncbi:MipA/OmpV family protein [Bradyrhizobium lablabi]|uniref:MipA/OmpV family protein n=1 Tax=Bradyrhizobium lablabi TaxID=722472 RepID=UPI001BA6B696|nr:MipA/OmpV family protein [Bradyrhizobium lablabi]MBR1125664.1 MipA/OmpV family protein [Bradyrhizobium lablabi]